MANQLDFRVKNGLIVGGNADIGGAITSADSVQLDTTVTYAPPEKGKLIWNEDEGSLDVGLGNGVVANLPEEVLYPATNNTASTIPMGTLVAAAGTTGNSGKILIAPYDSAIHAVQQIMGLTTESIISGANGHVTHFGKVRGIQTNGANYGEVWSDFDIIYAKPGGGLTKTVPAAPNSKTIVALVISAHPSNGTLFVRPTLSSSIANDDLVQLGTLANNDFLVYNSTAGRFENKTRQATTNIVAGAVTAGQFLRGDGTNVVMSAIQASDVPTLNQNTTGSAAVGTAVTLTATNTTNASHFLTFTDTATGNQNLRTDTDLTYNPSTNTLSVGAAVLSAGTANGVLYLNGSKEVTSGTNITFDGSILTVNRNAAGQGIATSFGSAAVRLDTSVTHSGSGEVILNAYPTAAPTTASVMYLQLGGTTSMALSGSGVDVKSKLAVGYSNFTNIPTNGAAFAGGVGIGTSAPGSPLEIALAASPDTVGAANKWSARFRDTTTSAINVGGSLLFQGLKSAAGSVGNFGAIAGRKENGTDNNEAGYLAFYTVPNSTGIITERGRFTSLGNFGIDTATPANKFVVSNAGANGIEVDPTSGLIQTFNRSTAAYTTMNLYANTLYVRTGASPTISMTVDVNGLVGIGQTTPQARLQVEELGIDTTTTTLGIGTGATEVYSVGTTLFRTMELMIQITQGSNYHAVKLFVLHNGTDVWFNQTNVLHTAAELGTFSMDISSGNVRAIYTPTSTAVASTVKVAAMKIAV
jgi:hypothetical protein